MESKRERSYESQIKCFVRALIVLAVAAVVVGLLSNRPKTGGGFAICLIAGPLIWIFHELVIKPKRRRRQQELDGRIDLVVQTLINNSLIQY
jgi:hypothetical protein